MADTFYLTNRIQMELNNLERGHVYYSVDEQPEVCARLVAKFFQPRIKKSDYDDANEVITGKLDKEEIWGHRVSVTVQSWDDVPAAIGLIRERQQKFEQKVR